MRPADRPSLTVPQLRALLYVRRTPGCSVSAVAEHLGIGPATTSAMVDRLLRMSLLEPAPDLRDRRPGALNLTPVGDAHLDAVMDAIQTSFAAALWGLDSSDLRELQEGLRQFAAQLRARELDEPRSAEARCPPATHRRPPAS